jgi:hypothetical protein
MNISRLISWRAKTRATPRLDRGTAFARGARIGGDTMRLRPGRIAIAAFAAMALTGCATMNVSSHIERGVDFAQFRTWDWGPADALPTGDPRLDNNPFFNDYLQGAVEKAMTRHHYDHVTEGTPDLLLHYHANVSKTFEVNGVDMRNGYCYDDCEPKVIEYMQGTIVLDVVSTKTNRVVWRGWSQDSMEGVIDNQDRLKAEINESITRMMKEMPPHL